MNDLFARTFEGLTILVTGHTGFKGSWLTIWLKEMGANVVGYSLKDPPTQPSNFEVCGVASKIKDLRGDVCNYEGLKQALEEHEPQIVIHLAAQTTVIPSYQDPKGYFETNVAGTINLLEAVRTTNSVKAIVVCSSDKVYENNEWVWGYRENDPLGGHDPYSMSKAMADLAATSYRRSFFDGTRSSEKRVALGTVRAGNVIGGGDFTEYGLIADSMKSLLAGFPIPLRNPYSIRPWQYVLEPLSGYLCLAAKLYQEGDGRYAEAWNFGPVQHKGITTQALVERLVASWGGGSWVSVQSENQPLPHEARYLYLNWDKAARLLDWRPVFSIEESLVETVKWYKAYVDGKDMYRECSERIQTYVHKATDLHLEWTCST